MQRTRKGRGFPDLCMFPWLSGQYPLLREIARQAPRHLMLQRVHHLPIARSAFGLFPHSTPPLSKSISSIACNDALRLAWLFPFEEIEDPFMLGPPTCPIRRVSHAYRFGNAPCSHLPSRQRFSRFSVRGRAGISTFSYSSEMMRFVRAVTSAFTCSRSTPGHSPSR